MRPNSRSAASASSRFGDGNRQGYLRAETNPRTHRTNGPMIPGPKTLRFLKKARSGYARLFPDSARFSFNYNLAQVKGQAASDRIKQELLAPKPSMICRFGSTELYSLLGYLGHKAGYQPGLLNHLRFITGRIPSYGYDPESIENMFQLSGFFPPDLDLSVRFGDLMMQDMKEVDILGTWRREELFFEKELAHALKVELPDLEPFLHKDPWSEVLEGRTVLLVHPFERSIQEQYARREKLFKDPRVLPAFELKTIRAVQTVAGNPTSFKNWFEALQYMKDRMSETTYDVAIIGCGAYGFPLAAHAKRMGRKAVHIGGATQLLFGIGGARWENHPLKNEYWVRPSANERPENASIVEGACYW